MQNDPPPIPPSPIDYASPEKPLDYAPPPARKSISSLLSPRITLHAWVIAGSVLMTTMFGVPKLETVFKDFKIELPWITRVTLIFSRLIVNDYLWLPALLAVIALPFALTALIHSGRPTPEEKRGREIWICRGLRALALLVILWTALALFLPYSALIQSFTGSQK